MSTHSVVILYPVVPESDKVDNVGVLELGETLEDFDQHLLPTALSTRVAYLVPHNLHTVVRVHGQVGRINARDVTGYLHRSTIQL